VAIDEYLSDQILLYAAMAEGESEWTTSALKSHCLSSTRECGHGWWRALPEIQALRTFWVPLNRLRQGFETGEEGACGSKANLKVSWAAVQPMKEPQPY
jgi:hypothetical protein